MSILVKIAIVAMFSVVAVQPIEAPEVASSPILIASFSGSVGSLAAL